MNKTYSWLNYVSKHHCFKDYRKVIEIIMTSKKAFTLIELLIVVAIIAILAAIAVPNFLEAQTRSKVSRVKNDMRSMSTAMESYMIDQNSYPTTTGTNRTNATYAPGTILYSREALNRLSTPVAYMTNGVLADPFADKSADTSKQTNVGYMNLADAGSWNGTNILTSQGGLTALQAGKIIGTDRWALQSVGPDGKNFVFGTDGKTLDPAKFKNAMISICKETGGDFTFFYDATNGTSSVGDIVRTGSQQY